MLILVTFIFPPGFSNNILSPPPENYKVCTIDVNLAQLPTTKLSKPSGHGHYYRIDYEIVLLFGLTELKAMVAWKENVCLLWRTLLCLLLN